MCENKDKGKKAEIEKEKIKKELQKKGLIKSHELLP